MKIQSITLLSLLRTASSIPQEANKTVKRTNINGNNQSHGSKQIHARLASLWGESETKDDFDWYESIEHFLRESSMSYSHDSSSSSDSDSNTIWNPIITPSPTPPKESDPTSDPITTPAPTPDASVPVNVIDTNTTSAPTSVPVPDPTQNPISDPTSSPTQKLTQESIPTTSPTSTPTQNALNGDEDQELETLRKCPAEAKGDESSESEETVVISLTFSYAAETNTYDMNFIALLEATILDSVATAVCPSFIRRVRSLRETSARRLDVVSVDSEPGDKVSSTDTCSVSDPEAVQCVVIDGAMTLGLDGKNTTDVEREALTAIKQSMETDAFISSNTPGLVKVRYLGPDPERSSINLRSIERPTESEQFSATPYVVLVSVGGAVFAFLLAAICMRRKAIQNKESDEKLGIELTDGVVVVGPKSSLSLESENETESETSRKEQCEL